MEKKPRRKSAASWQASDEKKNRKAHAACRKAPAGGKIYLPALPLQNPVWVAFGSDGKVTEFSIGKSHENAEKSG